MASSDDRSELKGIARSVDALFKSPDGEGSPSPPSDGQPGAAGQPVGPFAEAVAAFLQVPTGDRAEKVRTEATELREAVQLDPLADGVERLALEAGNPPDEAVLELARQILSPGVASRIAARLGATRDEDRRTELNRVARRLGHEMAMAISDALTATTDRSARRAFVDAMVAMGPAAMAVVEEMVEDGRWFVVRNAVAILGEAGGERAVELITASLAHTDPRVRREALLSLAKVGGDDAGMLVYGMIEDPDADVRQAAAMAAGALKVERALKPLLALLEDEEDEDVRIGILHALGQLGDPGAVQSIEKHAVNSFFSRNPTDERIAAYRALCRIGTPHAMKVLEEATEDKDPEVRREVRALVREKEKARAAMATDPV